MPTKGAHPPTAQQAGHERDVSNLGQDLSDSTFENSDEVPKKLLCPVCQKAFGRKYHLVRHLRNTACSGEQSFSLPCPSCGKVFSSKAKLDLHTRTHSTSDSDQKSSPLKRFECTECKRLFWSRSQLEIHKRTHSGERPFTCGECSRGFVSLGALNKHKLSHQEEKPFSCPYCSAKFSLKGTLNRHIPTHTGIRTHKCPHCPKDFIQAVALRAHLFSHTGLNGFPCHICGHVFSRKSRLKEHVLSVHEGLRQFACDTCSKKFSRKDDLFTHQDHAHGLARKPLGGLNTSKGRFTLLKASSGSLLPPSQAFAQEIRLGDTVITRQTAPIMLQEPASGTVTTNVKSELAQVGNGTHLPLSTFRHTQKCKDLSNVQKSCTKQSSMMSNHDNGSSAALSAKTQFQLPQKLCTDNLSTNFCMVENGSNIPKQLKADVSLHSLYGSGIFCKADKASKQFDTRCTNNTPPVGQKSSSDLPKRIEEFLCILIEKPVLEKLGWPNSPLSDLLEAVICHCGCSPSQFHCDTPEDKLRDNCKVLFTKVLEDDVAGKLLDNEETVDVVLDKVLELARFETS